MLGADQKGDFVDGQAGMCMGGAWHLVVGKLGHAWRGAWGDVGDMKMMLQ